jgi:cobalt-zinc-cadmium efflux system membrane fusion protein
MPKPALLPAAALLLALPALAATPLPADEGGTPRRAQQPPAPSCSISSTTITLASPAVARAAGFEYSPIARESLARELVRNAELAYDAERYARLSSRAPGVVVEVLAELGEQVEAGQAIARLESSALGSARADLLQAAELVSLWEANADREAALVEKGVGTQRALLEAKTKLSEARIALSRAKQRLRNLGLSESDLVRAVRTQDTGSLLPVRAPFAGTLVERDAVIGETVDERDVLFALADTSTMWAMIDLGESDLAVVRAGQPVAFRSPALGGGIARGTLTWISTELDRKTRTLKARAELENPDGLLKAFLFGTVTISAGRSDTALFVPKSAVQWEGCCNVAFVRSDAEGTIFRPARLTLGFDAGNGYEVIAGLSGGEDVVTEGSFILKNELLKDAMGAGCCEVDHLSE